MLACADLPLAPAPVAPRVVLVGPGVQPAVAEHAVLGNPPPGGAPSLSLRPLLFRHLLAKLLQYL